MAGQRKYSLVMLNRTGLAGLTERASRVTGLPTVDVDSEIFGTILQ
ncbi:MAG: hypothetical protein QW406_02760 [Ignisphaera sp.]